MSDERLLGRLEARVDQLEEDVRELKRGAESTGQHELSKVELELGRMKDAEKARAVAGTGRAFDVVKIILAAAVGLVASNWRALVDWLSRPKGHP